MERVRFIPHKDKRILLVDLAGLNGREWLDVLDLAGELIRAEPFKSALVLYDATTFGIELRGMGGGYDREQTDKVRSHISRNRRFVNAVGAVVGTGERKRVIVEFYSRVSNRSIESFETREEALDWLAEQ